MSDAMGIENRYNPRTIEKKWQSIWSCNKVNKVVDDDPRPKWYELTMYPYPSGDLHIGHWYAMTPADAHARFRRMQGYNVLHPMGFDAFGLPAENAAIKRGIHPFKWTNENMENMRRQLRTMGPIYDWDREVVTCDPSYYKWNQWLFLKLFEMGLAYRSFAPANWCPSCNTVLANEQVMPDGKCERCNSLVTHRDLNQWFFRITKYADELLDHSAIQWPNKINVMQSNWIGRSEGIEVEFAISEHSLKLIDVPLKTFTTRIDTIFGVTFIVIAPEHPLVSSITTPDRKQAVDEYIKAAKLQSEVERLSTENEKTGVFSGSYCVNKLNNDNIPIFIADYVLSTYGTGVVMGVPAHDQRDFEFAEKYGLPKKIVIEPPDWDGKELNEAYIGNGKQVNSGDFNGKRNEDAWNSIADYIEINNWGRRTVNYRMRDWLISRQRYWGTPIPIVYCPTCGTVPVSEKDLPVLLPENAEFRPTGESPLALHRDFTDVECPQCNQSARRETDTMDTFVDSSWYFLRYTSPNHNESAFDPISIKSWGPVDQYTGGAEHAVMHLLYARFITKALRDIGLIDFGEPFTRLFNQGHIIANHQKMSKSRGNVISPDEYVENFGADAVRCYLMFLGPWDQGGDWTDSGINGMSRWLNRVWDMSQRNSKSLNQKVKKSETIDVTQRLKHKTIRKVGADLEIFKFNTALASLMEYTNHLSQIWEQNSIDPDNWDDSIDKLLLMMACMAPHITEELWERRGHTNSIHDELWPKWSSDIAADEVFTLVVQVNGKLRDKIEVSSLIDEKEASELALNSERISTYVVNKPIRKVIYVPGKLVNIVV